MNPSYRPTADDGALLTYTEAAVIVGVRPTTVRDWTSRGLLPSLRLDGVVYVPERQLLECERDRRRSGKRHQRVTADGC